MHGDAADTFKAGMDAAAEAHVCDMNLVRPGASLRPYEGIAIATETGVEARCDPLARVDQYVDKFSALTLGASMLTAYGISKIIKRH